MVSPDAALLGAYVLLLVGIVVQYRRGKVSAARLPLLAGLCLVWLSYGVARLTRTGPFAAESPANAALGALAAGLLAVGLYALVRWYRHR